MNRATVIQNIVDRIRARFYLEIGVAKGTTFSAIQVKEKVGVDPNPKTKDPLVMKMTSDEFFKRYEDFYGDKRIDVCFVDGLHTYEQALRDVNNALSHLNERGVIVVDDCSPITSSMADIKNEHLADEGYAWCGDVWKVIAHLRSLRNDLQVFVLPIEFGMGIIRKGRSESVLTYSEKEIKEMTYEDLRNKRNELLSIKHLAEFKQFLKDKN